MNDFNSAYLALNQEDREIVADAFRNSRDRWRNRANNGPVSRFMSAAYGLVADSCDSASDAELSALAFLEADFNLDRRF